MMTILLAICVSYVIGTIVTAEIVAGAIIGVERELKEIRRIMESDVVFMDETWKSELMK